jgi:translocation and assembly module TamB
MSDIKPESTAEPTVNSAKPPIRYRRWAHVTAWIFASFAILLLLVAAVGTWYTTTSDFQRRVGGEVVSVLQDATGGRVELQHISFSLWHLAIEADGLVIHGTEGPNELPYLSAGKIFIRVKINTFLSRAAGSGPQSRIGLSYLRVEQPRFHLIIDKDGKTNQPTPKHSTPSNEPIQDTLLDLRAGKVELADGLAVLNDRAIPFDVAANNLNVEVHYIHSTDRYGATVDLSDLRTKMAQQPEVQSKLHLTAEIGRDMAALKSFDFTTGASTHLSASAAINHFAKPDWNAKVSGSIDLKQLSLLADVDGLDAGTIDLDVNGHNCTVTPQVAQKHPHFWQHHKQVPAAAKVLPPDPDCKAGYLLVGNVKMHNAGYRNEYVRVHDINGGAQLHITPTELLFTALSGYLPGGGNAKGDLKIENWLGEVPADAPAASATAVAAATTANTTAKGLGAKAPIESMRTQKVGRAHAYLTVTVDHIPLRTIMEITEKKYGDLGFDTSITGPTTVEWGGPANSIADSVQVQASLKDPAGNLQHTANHPHLQRYPRRQRRRPSHQPPGQPPGPRPRRV